MRGLRFIILSTIIVVGITIWQRLTEIKGIDVGHPDETYIDEFGDII